MVNKSRRRSPRKPRKSSPRKSPVGQVEAKPTTYRKTRYKSRLEARWAVFLDYHFLVDQFAYEPLKVAHPDKRWTYIPDFVLKVGPLHFFLEVKPVQPTDEYMEVLHQFAQVLRYPLLLATGSFYRRTPTVQNLTTGEGPWKLKSWPQLPDPTQAIDAARKIRFDIPHGPPPFRDGSQAKLQATVRQAHRRLRERGDQ